MDGRTSPHSTSLLPRQNPNNRPGLKHGRRTRTGDRTEAGDRQPPAWTLGEARKRQPPAVGERTRHSRVNALPTPCRRSGGRQVGRPVSLEAARRYGRQHLALTIGSAGRLATPSGGQLREPPTSRHKVPGVTAARRQLQGCHARGARPSMGLVSDVERAMRQRCGRIAGRFSGRGRLGARANRVDDKSRPATSPARRQAGLAQVLERVHFDHQPEAIPSASGIQRIMRVGMPRARSTIVW